MRFLLAVVLLAPHAAALSLGLGAEAARQSAKTVGTAAAVVASATSDLPDCTSDRPFSVAPIPLANVRGIVPLGNFSPPPHTLPADHTYLYFKLTDPLDPSSPKVTSIVSAPGPITVTQVTSQIAGPPGGPTVSDFGVTFQPCKQLTGVFGHVGSLSGPLSGLGSGGSCSSYSTGATNVTQCTNNVKIKVASGTALGMVGGGSSAALDFGTYDTRSSLVFASPTHHYPDQYQTVCPYDYYTPAAKADIEGLLGAYDGSVFRTVPPLCWTIAQDVSGTAQGDWYHVGSPDNPEDPHLTLAHDNVVVSSGVISSGTSVPGLQGRGTFTFLPTHAGFVGREFSEVTADGNVYCYDSFASLPGAVLLIKMNDASSLLMENRAAASCGAGSWALTGAAVAFTR